MTERELRAVAEAIAEQVYTMHALTKPAEFEAIVNRAAQVAISASDSQYVKGLVEALRFYANKKTYETSGHSQIDADMKPINDDVGKRSVDALQNLPEDLR